MPKKLTRREFVQRSRKIHGKKYLYHRVDYKSCCNKVEIWCRKCKKFFKQTPDNHWARKGCEKCSYILRGLNRRYSVKEIENKFIETHGNKYTYNQDYIDCNHKIKITCHIHGEFWQYSGHHLKGHGCPYCSKNKNYTFEEFEEKANRIHNNKYIYYQDFIKSTEKIKIKCLIHGVFYQKPDNHIQGNGCFICGRIKSKESQTKSIEQAEYEFNKIHNNKYKYHQDYVNDVTKIKIKCPDHGEFEQTPGSHLRGSSCPCCVKKPDKTQKEIHKLISEITRLKFSYNIKLPKLQRLEIDIYNHRKRLAIEYQGEQHYLRYTTGKYIYTKDNILKIQQRDRKKKRLCKKLGINLIIIPCYRWGKLKTIKEKRLYLREKIDGKRKFSR